MKIRTDAKRIIKEIPTSLRTAARKERQAFLKEQRKNPINASFMASNGYFPFTHNQNLRAQIAKLKTVSAGTAYTNYKNVNIQSRPFPINDSGFVRASSIL